ncbi:hypothetical protein ACEPAI_6620 [Sanghuangporus weigelae]
MLNWPALLPAMKGCIRALFTGDHSRSVLPFVPRPLRILLLLILILNSRSLPFTWHFRVFRPVLYVRFRALLLYFAPKKTRDAWLDSMCPIGKSPFELKGSYVTWASLDESDYNIHLSNSSYAKVLDMLRLKYSLAHLSTVFRDGCWIALGATHLKFIREIPLGRKYEMRMYIGSWDSKWMYIIARFVSKDKSKSGDSKTQERLQGAKEALQAVSSSPNGIPMPRFHTPAIPDVSGFTTPNPLLISSAEDFNSLWSEAPGETLHCVAMNEVCFKNGRVTVPPALALASAGCGLSQEKWEEVKKLRSGRRMRELLVGGWRDVPDHERWWEEAMFQFEDDRVRRLNVLKGMREGLEATRLL